MQGSDYAGVLLALAREDAVAASGMVDRAIFTDAIVGFHAQQAIEKAMKAVLEARRVQYPFTHDLVKLLSLLATCGIICPVSADDAERFNPFAVHLRYDMEAVVGSAAVPDRAYA